MNTLIQLYKSENVTKHHKTVDNIKVNYCQTLNRIVFDWPVDPVSVRDPDCYTGVVSIPTRDKCLCDEMEFCTRWGILLLYLIKYRQHIKFGGFLISLDMTFPVTLTFIFHYLLFATNVLTYFLAIRRTVATYNLFPRLSMNKMNKWHITSMEGDICALTSLWVSLRTVEVLSNVKQKKTQKNWELKKNDIRYWINILRILFFVLFTYFK